MRYYHKDKSSNYSSNSSSSCIQVAFGFLKRKKSPKERRQNENLYICKGKQKMIHLLEKMDQMPDNHNNINSFDRLFTNE